MRDYENTAKALRCCRLTSARGCAECPYSVNNNEKCAHLLNDAADAIEELLAAVPHWISVEERLPEFVMNNSGCVCTTKLLFRTEHKTIHIGYAIRTYHNIETVEGYECIVVDRWYDQSGDMIEDVTHWMPLPEPPKEDAE